MSECVISSLLQCAYLFSRLFQNICIQSTYFCVTAFQIGWGIVCCKASQWDSDHGAPSLITAPSTFWMMTLSPHTQVQTCMKNADIHQQVNSWSINVPTESPEIYYDHTYLGIWLEWAKLWIQYLDKYYVVNHKGQAYLTPLISKNIKACTNYKSPTQVSSNQSMIKECLPWIQSVQYSPW